MNIYEPGRTIEGERWLGEAADQQEQERHTVKTVQGILVDAVPNDCIVLSVWSSNYNARVLHHLTSEEATELALALVAADRISEGWTP